MSTPTRLLLKRCDRYPDTRAYHRNKLPCLPVPPFPHRNGITESVSRYTMTVLNCSGTIYTRAAREGFSIDQADRWACHHNLHPATVWGRLWVDLGRVDAATYRRDRRLADLVAWHQPLSETFTAHIRHVRQTHRSR